MKWIGQHIWDYISRFRNDIYLEDIDSGTIASGGNLGLDSNNKIVKSASPSGSIDLTSEVTGTLPVANGGTGATSLTDNSVLTGTGTSPITAEANFTYNGTAMSINALTSTFTNATASGIYIKNTGNNANGGKLYLENERSAGVDSDVAGAIVFNANDDGGNASTVVEIEGKLAESAHGSEEGAFAIDMLTASGSTLRNVLNAGSSAGDVVDVNLGFGATSTTTIAGTLTMGSTAALNNSGVIQVASQPNITTLAGFVTGSANQLITDDGDGTVTSESGLTWDGDDLTITSASTARPDVYIKTTANHAKPPHLYFLKDKGAAGVNGDQPGLIAFMGDNADQTLRTFAQIITFATEVTAGDEAGQISIEVASSSGTTSVSRNAFTAIGSSSAYQVDTTIGFGTSSTATIAGDLDIDGDAITSAGNLTVTPGGTLELDSTGDMTLDSSANIELNADGGEIVFKDDTATLAKISADGLSFVDNTGAGIIFEGTTDDAYNTTLTAADTTSSSKTITLPDATGTVQLQGENTGQVVHINIQDLNSYIFYMYNDDSWYSAGGQTLAILGTSTAPSDISSANSEYQSRVGCYTAIANCTVKKLTFTFYWTSSAVNSADVDFAFTKFTPITDGTAATITMNAIAATDHNASYTEVKPYQVTFTFSGGNASLSAGDSFGFHMRTTGGSSAQRVIVYGNAMLSVELN